MDTQIDARNADTAFPPAEVLAKEPLPVIDEKARRSHRRVMWTAAAAVVTVIAASSALGRYIYERANVLNEVAIEAGMAIFNHTTSCGQFAKDQKIPFKFDRKKPLWFFDNHVTGEVLITELGTDNGSPLRVRGRIFVAGEDTGERVAQVVYGRVGCPSVR